MGLPDKNKFANKGAAAKPGAAKSKVKESRFGTFTKRDEGPPMLECMQDRTRATYRVRFESAEEVQSPRPDGNDSIKAYVTVLDGDGPTPKGTRCLVLHMQNTAGRNEYNAQIVATAGYDADNETDLAAYLEFDPKGDFFAASVGDANDYADEAAQLVGRVVDVQVGYKKAFGDGYFRSYSWAPVPDEDDDQTSGPKIERIAT